MSHLNRRHFLQGVSAIGTGLAVAGANDRADAQPAGEVPNPNAWPGLPNRVWIGPEFWSNPLQDWRLANGKLECTNAAPNRNVHWLTKSLGEKGGSFAIQVTVSRAEEVPLASGKGSAGFRIGIRGPVEDYRSGVISGNGLEAGLNVTDGLFLGRVKSKSPVKTVLNRPAIRLKLSAEQTGQDYALRLFAYDANTGELLDDVQQEHVPADQLRGGMALVNNFGASGRRANAPPSGMGRFVFSDWEITGSKVEDHPERAFGPILFSQYTLSNGILKLTAQMPPLGEDDSQTVELQLRQENGTWKTAGEEAIHPEARTATFRLTDWNDKTDTAYRLRYVQKYKNGNETRAHIYEWEGTIRRDPVDKDVVTVADVSCNIHTAFPNAPYVANMAKLDPDLLAFVGDQFYESSGGYGIQTVPLDKAILDYLRKWWLHGWTWRELMKDRPSISLPDDHDVYQGNIWGESGAPQGKTQEEGGYRLPAEWVNVVHRTQTSHHPDAFDPTPIQQEISVYYGPMIYGRLSFAILADRMFKNGPDGKVPPTGDRADHVIDPNFDPKTADLPGLKLLGERQLKFLSAWASDWKGADMKAVISQTIFTAMATTHGGNRQRLEADYDTNGWPQTQRNQALKEMRKAFAVHLAGDQHLPAVVHYGIDNYKDAGVAFAGPAVNVGYPRWWEPEAPGENRQPGSPENTGDFLDHFGNKMTVLAVKNGPAEPSPKLIEGLADKTSGLGIVRFDKRQQEITIECWPFLADPTEPHSHFPGWPITLKMLDNYARKPAGFLPTIKIQGTENPVLQVINNKTQEIEYTLRMEGDSFRPMIFDTEASYSVKIGADEPKFIQELSDLKPEAERSIEITI